MQRQAVPTLIRAEAHLVGTGMEATVARDSGVCALLHVVVVLLIQLMLVVLLFVLMKRN